MPHAEPPPRLIRRRTAGDGVFLHVRQSEQVDGTLTASVASRLRPGDALLGAAPLGVVVRSRFRAGLVRLLDCEACDEDWARSKARACRRANQDCAANRRARWRRPGDLAVGHAGQASNAATTSCINAYRSSGRF